MTVKTKLDFKDYLKLSYLLTYRKPLMVWITFVGAVMLVLGLRAVIETRQSDSNSIYQIVFGLVMSVLAPLSILWSARKHFASNARIHETIEYEFDLQRIKVKGESFYSEIDWEKTYKVWEISEWFLIYQNNLVFNIIPKRFLTDIQLVEFRNLLRQSPIHNLVIKK
jgi:hypothetical protein